MPVGGAETLLVNMMRGMDSGKIAPEVICLKEPGPLGEQIQDEFPVHSRLIGGKWDIAVAWRLARLMKRRKFDVVITVGAGDKMFWGRLAAALARVPVIASALHSTGWPDGVGRLNRLLTPITDAVIGVADSHGEFLRSFEKFPADKVHVIRNGVDCERFSPNPDARSSLRKELSLPSGTPLIGIVAALRSEKNHSMLVRAASKLKSQHPDAHWIIVGDGPERPTIESLAKELGVADRIHLLGTRYDTPAILAALDVFTLCSLNEASPVSILESLACGVPVVATDVGSVSETVIHEGTGLLIASEDTDAMSESIGRLLGDASLRQQMGTAGRKLVLETGSLVSMVAGYQDLAMTQYARHASRKTAGKIAEEKAMPLREWNRLGTTHDRRLG
ncbi:glycosyltransferase family 4 protein [Rubripirellula obstinata]|nr:glycosyltransferase [Rubripirellula obstinata]